MEITPEAEDQLFEHVDRQIEELIGALAYAITWLESPRQTPKTVIKSLKQTISEAAVIRMGINGRRLRRKEEPTP